MYKLLLLVEDIFDIILIFNYNTVHFENTII